MTSDIKALSAQMVAAVRDYVARFERSLGERLDQLELRIKGIPEGPRGAQGERGLHGDKGEQGPRGEQGERGATGDPGAPGAFGARGERGDPGAEGQRGAPGDRGPQGEAGAVGPAGQKGERGEAGKDGAPGQPGQQGEPGAVGPAGPAGAAGKDGGDGQDGATGATGAKGEQGIPGERGAQGERGEAGAKGERGEDGATGATGAKGEQGIPGERGPQGERGEPGAKGERGEQGLRGADVDAEEIRQMLVPMVERTQAAIAEQIDARVAALPRPRDGAPGQAGTDGAPGQQGPTGATGATGEKGERGEDGRDATQIDPLPSIDPARSYPRGTWACYAGGLVRAARATTPLKAAELQYSGWVVVVEGLSAIAITQGEDLREISVSAMLTSGIKATSDFRIPMLIYKEVWRAGSEYTHGDIVTWAGSSWHCQEAKTSDKPGTSAAWKLMVKCGRDGKDGVLKQAPAQRSVRV